MAPVLLCPECGTKHPLDNVAANSVFPCTGCGRTLKVPAQAREMASAAGASAAASSAPPPVAPAPEPPLVSSGPDADVHATQVFAAVPPEPRPPVATAPPLGPPQGIAALDLARERELQEVQAPKVASTGTVPAAWIRFLLWIVAVPIAFLVVFGVARLMGLLTTTDITDVALAEGWRRFWPIIRLLPFVAIVTALIVTGGVYGIARLRARPKPSGTRGSGPKAPRSRQSSGAGA